MAAPHPLADRAVALASAAGPGDDGGDAVSQLASSGDQGELESARQYLVWRIQQRSDDYQATAALTLVNRALARVGWHDPYAWKHRRKP